jgi:hypothetical protein
VPILRASENWIDDKYIRCGKCEKAIYYPTIIKHRDMCDKLPGPLDLAEMFRDDPDLQVIDLKVEFRDKYKLKVSPKIIKERLRIGGMTEEELDGRVGSEYTKRHLRKMRRISYRPKNSSVRCKNCEIYLDAPGVKKGKNGLCGECAGTEPKYIWDKVGSDYGLDGTSITNRHVYIPKQYR